MLLPIFGQIIIIPIYIVCLFIAIKKKIPLYKHLILFIFFIYISVVVSITLFPMPISPEGINNYSGLSNNFIPLKSIYQLLQTNMRTILRNIFGNILLLVPLGFLVPLLNEKFNNIKSIVVLGTIFSVGIELSQYILSIIIGYTYKVTDIDDIILNIIGVILGYIAYKLVCIIKK